VVHARDIEGVGRSCSCGGGEEERAGLSMVRPGAGHGTCWKPAAAILLNVRLVKARNKGGLEGKAQRGHSERTMRETSRGL
jgi:hypothetical protein